MPPENEFVLRQAPLYVKINKNITDSLALMSDPVNRRYLCEWPIIPTFKKVYQ